jgi:GWxTD domain-containing protein
MITLLLLVALTNGTMGQRRVQDLSSSPEAYFLTADEPKEWSKLTSEEQRSEFRNEYWRRRDPTPASERNEFRELVLSRIQTADERFAIGKTPGSRTARGLVFIVFGPPAVQRQTMGPVKSAPEMIAPGRLGIPSEAFETREWHTWVYDREANADLLAIFGVPSLEIAFIFDPGRRDELQDASRFQQWREIVARRSIRAGQEWRERQEGPNLPFLPVQR